MRSFLIGGGRGAVAAHRPFVEAAGGPVVVFVVDAGDGAEPDRWIGEHTTLEADGQTLTVHGQGAATRVRMSGDRFELTVHLAGDPIPATSVV